MLMFENLCRIGVLYRISMCSLAVLMSMFAELEPRSMMALMARTNAGSFLCISLGITGAIGLIDALINDLLPRSYKWRVAFRQRHFILVALAFEYTASFYVSLSTVQSNAMCLFFGWNTLSLVTLAFLDATTRSTERRYGRVCNRA